MAQYTQRTQPMHRPGQTEHGHVGGGALAYGGGGGGGGSKPSSGAVVAPPQPRAPPAAPYAPHHYSQLRLPGYGSAALSYRDGSYGRSGGGGAVGEYRGAGARMSLIGTAYLPPPAPPAHHPPPADPPPYKKIRITQDRPTIHHQQLRVDTREPVNSYNTVEVLSPNPPSEPTVEDQSFRTTKDDLLQQISKVDREMALSESTLAKLKKKQEELEQTASKPAKSEEPEEAVPRHRSLAQCVYADNRKKAGSAHNVLSHLGPPVLCPLYNQPQDSEVYHENIRKNKIFRKRLAEHIRRLKLDSEKREDTLAEAYTKRAAEWLRRVERIEQGQKRKAKEARNREFFEKVFPELRKQREERERFNRLGARVKSEAELEEIADGLHEQEHEDKKMRSLTVVPPLRRDPADKRPVYIDTNRRCMDMESEHKDLVLRNVWSRNERELFRDKFLQHPKNFGQVASFLPRKSVQDCVRFYYLSKKAENYKQLLRKPRQRRPPRGPRPAPEPELPAGVTTRLQRATTQQGSTPRAESKEMEESVSSGSTGADRNTPLNEPVSCIPVPATPNTQRPELSRTPPLPPSPPPASSAPPAPVTSTSSGTMPAGSPATPPAPDDPQPADVTPTTETSSPTTTTTSVPAPTTSAPSSTAGSPPGAAPPCSPAPAALWVPTSTSAPPTPQPAQPPTPTQPPPTPEPAVIERISTPSTPCPSSASTSAVVTSCGATTTTVSVPVPAACSACAVCGAAGASRTVSRSRASHYGLKEDAVGARVCEPCHCRCVRSRYTRCPVPTCPGPRVRAKRLRHLPPRWHDLTHELKRPLMEEFQIPSELSKCCLACFKRITRRLETIGEGPPQEPTEEEASRFRTLIREHGTAWERMASASGRTPASLKAFYFTYRKKFQLDALVAERPPPKGSVGSDTDDSVLSSGDTDTASADSPRPPPQPGPRTDAVAPKIRKRDEYDSSATETADEESEPSAKIIPTITLSTAVSSSGPSPPAAGGAPVSGAGCARNGPGAPPLTVRDVVLNMIEISLMKNSQPVPPGSKLQPPKVTTCSAREPLATLSVVNPSHVASSSPSSPHRPATITPLQPDKEVVVVIEGRSDARAESLLDLSVKRPRHEQTPPATIHPKTPYRNSTEYQPYRQPERESPTQYNSKPKPVPTPPRPSLKPVPNPKGSITLGTPVENRFEARRTPPDPKTGSITAGTPVHHLPEKKSFDYYKRRSPAGTAYYPGVTSQPRPQSPSFSPNAGAYTRPYGLDNRQIIMTDFITSQQMHGGARRDRPPDRPASPQYSPQRRDQPVSVIQRHHTTVYQHTHPHPPPGHEAFTSLVDVASAATALPVPRGAQPEPKPEPKQTAHPSQHDIRLSDTLQRHMAMGQKYQTMHQQQLQYQVIERDRRAQYLERDRQIVLQQNRERERAMAAMQERHIAMEQQHQQQQHQQHQQQQQQHQQQQQQQQQHQQQQQQHQQQQQQHQQQQHQHQQQMMHERHLQHQQSVSQENERRMLAASAYSTAKHRAVAPPPPAQPQQQQAHVERKDSRGSVVSSATCPPASVVGGAPAEVRPRPAEGTLTAASLIDAIITHQISQTSDQRFPGTAQGLSREDPCSVSGSERVERVPPGEEPLSQHTTSMKLGDLASNIITRDFCSPTTSILHHNSRFVANSEAYSGSGGVGVGGGGVGGVSSAGDEWKRRDAPKHAPYLEPVSPPDNHHTNRTSSMRRGGGVSGGGSVLTAYDYVTHRIVEVMRSDADERAKPAPVAFPAGAYYPYSALNVATASAEGAAPQSSAPSAPAAPAPPPPPEPAPLMSAQYEPLSDED